MENLQKRTDRTCQNNCSAICDNCKKPKQTNTLEDCSCGNGNIWIIDSVEVEEKLMDAKELTTIFMKHINLRLENEIVKANKLLKNQKITHDILFDKEWNDKLENAINLVIENNLKNK